MKKTLLTLFVAFLGIVLMYGLANAISGPCSNCHTMHNSQDGAAMAKAFDGSALDTAQPHLTISTCLGCHNGQVTGAPDIFTAVAGADRTAGGTFLDSVATTDAKLHNVKDLDDAGVVPTVGLEDTLSTAPGAESGGFTEPTATTLSCAGTLGCHGDHTKAGSNNAISGFHHQPSGKGYRFLQFYDGSTATPIVGKGSSDWEKGGASATNHNVYYALSSDSASERDSISSLCSLCHGDFHDNGDTSASSLWTRHPTEVAIPSAWDSIGTGVTVDYTNNPFAFKTADYATVTPTAAYAFTDNPNVACISCHRAHGTANNDLLRFDYSAQNAGGGGTTGCLGCHTAQR